MHGTLQTRFSDETAEEVRVRRGTPEDTIQRIRTHYNLPVDLFEELEIFFLAYKFYYTEYHARENSKPDYEAFVANGRTVLPEYMYRCGDPDVDYPHMHSYG